MSEINKNTTYTNVNQISPIVDKVNSTDKSTIESLTSNFVQLIKNKHL
jgi:hypothetical protein